MSIKARRITQSVAVQCVHSIASRYPEDRDPIDESIEKIICYSEQDFEELDAERVKILVKGVFNYKKELIERIKPNLAPGWTFDRIGRLVQCILVLATYEVLYSDSKNSTIINDYLEIAKSFNHRGEVGFINSVLDRVAKSTTKITST